MIDFHCHLDLYKDPLSILPEVEKRCEFVLAVTTSPRAWATTSIKFKHISTVRTAIGLHPEILLNRIDELKALLNGVKLNRFIGEVGIDGSHQYSGSLDLQKKVFHEILLESEQCGGRILSIHSRNAATEVLDIIERHCSKSIPIMHWFSGSFDELERAKELGVWFSINPIMTFSDKGVDVISRLPLSSILPETDGPFTQKNGVPYMPWDTSIVINHLAKVFGETDKSIEVKVRHNLDNLINSFRYDRTT